MAVVILINMTYNDSIQVLVDNYNSLRELVEVSNSTISNELSSASYHLGALSIIIATVGIFLGIYVTVLYNKIRKIREEVDCNLEKISNMNEQIKDIDTKIHSNLSGLYSQLREEETRALLVRLVEEPLDIHNIDTLLLARNINESYFDLFKKAYLNLLKTGKENEGVFLRSTNKDAYFLLFFQHFCYQTVLDDDLRDDLSENFKQYMNCAFKRDIIKSTEDMCRALSIDAVPFDREKYLCKYLVALNESKYKDLIELRNILESQINNNTLLPSAIELATKDGVRLELFENLPKEIKK